MADIPDNIPTEDQQIVSELLDQKPPEFTDLTLTQHEAFRDGALSDGNHLLVAETGNGKTFVAEALIKKALKDGENIAYLVPSVALVAEKQETIAEWAPDNATINQGYGYADADVIVATFESYFEAVIRGLTERFQQVVLDDFHEIYSTFRGPDIEKGISAALDNDSSILAVSATVGNPHTVSRWLDADLTISSEDRAVAIKEMPVEKTDELYADQITDLIRQHWDKGPFLVFNQTRSNTETRARGVARNISFDVEQDVDFRQEVTKKVDTELTDTHKELIRLLKNGIAFHHSGLESGVKDLVEEYTEEGIIKCVFCTTTLSYGFDSPCQSVIAADLKRRSGFVGIYEYVQWIGRAGRSTDLYDEAYAFPMWRDEEAAEKYQFDITVEDKDLEDVTSHLSSDTALEWLVLELVAHGWERDTEIIDFLQSTLFWSECVDQVPSHVTADVDEQPAEEVIDEVENTLEELESLGLIHSPIGQPQRDATRYNATEMGEAVVEFEHSNWFSNSVRDVLELADWLEQNDDGLTPEQLVKRLGEAYYRCDLGEYIPPTGEVGKLLETHELDMTEGTTAALVCWFWCTGVPIRTIEDQFDGQFDLDGLPNVADKLATALDSIQLLYEPYEMPREPEWLEKFTTQVSEGIPGPDVYLVDSVEYFGRVRYNRLTEQLNNSGRGTDWDVGEDHYLIERLSALLADVDATDQFLHVVQSADKIGEEISENILEAVEAWSPSEHNRVEVPFLESLTERDDVLVQYHSTDSDTDGNTTLDTNTNQDGVKTLDQF
jgi:replicative superfamily II helicase